MKFSGYNSINYAIHLLCLFLIVFASLRAIDRYLFFESSIVSIGFGLSVYLLSFILIFKSKFIYNEILFKIIIIFIALLILFTLFYLYPIADALKLNLGGSDQDDCTIGIIENLTKGINPYHYISYNGNTCAQGPGTILIFLPFVVFKKYIFGHIFYLLLLLLVLKKFNNTYDFKRFTFLFFSSVILWEMFAVGSDLYVSSIFLCTAIILLNEAIIKNNLSLLVISAIMIGIFSITRINFMFIPFAISILLLTNWKNEAILFGITSISTTLIPIILLFLLNNHFISINSLHDYSFIFIHASNLEGTRIFHNLFGLISTLIIFIFFFLCLVKQQKVDLLILSIFCIIFPHLLSVSINDLIYFNYDFTIWEGANFLVPILSFGILLLSKKYIN